MGNTAKIRHRRRTRSRRLSRSERPSRRQRRRSRILARLVGTFNAQQAAYAPLIEAMRRLQEDPIADFDDGVIRVVGPRPLTMDEAIAAYSSVPADG